MEFLQNLNSSKFQKLLLVSLFGYSIIMDKKHGFKRILISACFLTLIQCSSDSVTKSTRSVVGGVLSVINSQLLFGFNLFNKRE